MRAHSKGFAALTAALSLAAGAASANGNRELHRFAVVPNPSTGGGAYIVTAIWTVDVEPTSVPLDFTTAVSLCVDGTPVQTLTVPVNVDPGSGTGCQLAPPCGGVCGSVTVEGQSESMICFEDRNDATSECDCGVWIETEFDPLDLTSREEVKVVLAALPGTVPDNDSGDDGQDEPWERPLGWGREPEPPGFHEVAEGRYDVRVPIQLEWDGLSGLLNLDMEAELRVNGVPRRTLNVPARAEQIVDQGCFVSGCMGACGTFNGATTFCDPLLWFDCACGARTFAMFPDEPLTPKDDIMVLLRPASGALPELPGLDEDDIVITRCCSPLAVGENGSAAPWRLDQNRPNPFTPRTSIVFALAVAGPARVEVFDVRGQLVRTVLDRPLGAGEWTVSWDGRTESGTPAPPGGYFYRLAASEGTVTRRMTLLR